MATLQQDFEKVQASFNADIATARKNGLVLLRLADAKQGTGAKQPEVSILPVSPEEQAEAVAAEGILQRGKEEILDAAARVQGSPSPVVGDKTTESTPTAAVRDEIPIDERAAAFEKNIRAKLADTIREEEAALNAVAGATESVKSAAAAVTEGVKHAAGHVEL